MSRNPRARRLFRLPSTQASVTGDVNAEIGFHLDERTQQLIARGYEPAAARAEALREFGDVGEATRELEEIDRRHTRRSERANSWRDLRQDLRYGVRAALRAPMFSLLAILTLALGIGANAAVFGVVKSLLLNSLPYDDAGRLVRIYARFESAPTLRSSVSPGAATDFAERLRTMSGVSWFNFSTFDVAYVDDAGSRVLPSASIGEHLLQTLGVRPVLGRALTTGDGVTGAVMLSHDVWQREFNGDRAVIGRSLQVERQSVEVVGVLPRDFVGPMGRADLYFALDLTNALSDPGTARGQNWLGVIGRLAPGATIEAAQREINAVAVALAREYPQSDRGRTFLAVPLRDSMVGETRTPLLVLMASAGLVLLVTCANLAGALLSRTISRRQEFAVRVALGARRGRLVRQLLAESVLLAMAGAALGLLVAAGGLGLLRALAATALPSLPANTKLSLDGGAVAATLVAALGTGLLFGLAPALAAGRWNPQGTLREEGRGTSETRRTRYLRGALVAGQIALSLSLLVGAGLLVRSLSAMTSAPLGFDPDGVLTARVALPGSAYQTPAVRSVFFRQLEERLAALQGVDGVASVTQIPSPTMSSNALSIDGVTLAGDGPTFIPYMAVSDDFFRVMKIELLQGRLFGAEDAFDASPAIVVNESMARTYWPAGNAVGARVRISPHTSERWGIVVGIVRSLRVDPALPLPGPMAFASNRQDILWSGRDFLVRTAGDPAALIPLFRRELKSLDPMVPLRDPTPLRAILDERMATRRFPVVLMTAFGALALVLASVGVYAMFANMTAAREREFGMRVALGASRRGIAALVLKQGAAWMILGLAGGAIGVILVGRAIRDLLYDVAPLDPWALGLAVLLLMVCAALALFGPVRRATRVDPIRVLH